MSGLSQTNVPLLVVQSSAGADQFSYDKRGADFTRRGVHWCTTKKLTERCSSSGTVFCYVLVISDQDYNNDNSNVHYTHHF